MASERAPLLKNQQDAKSYPTYGQPSDRGENDPANVVNVTPVRMDELPPPYSAAGQGGNLMISCKVCSFMIDISTKRDQHVVKCSNCNEATPVRKAPSGKKYVRCPCNCLLICKSNSERISCPRPQCKRIIGLTPASSTPTTPTLPGMCQVSCAHCQNLFLFNSYNNSLARCPHCRKVSSVGPNFSQYRGRIYVILTFLFLCATALTIVLTSKYLKYHGALYAVFVGLPLIAVYFCARAIYYCSIKVSEIEGAI